MLKFFRTKAVTKVVLWAIIILILPAFVLFGTERLSRGKGPAFAGLIDSKKISFTALFSSMVGGRTDLILKYWNQPDKLREMLNNRPLMAQVAWERLILLNEAKKARITVSDREVANFIRAHPLFARNGAFDDAMYAYFLKNNVGSSARSFEEAARESLVIDKVIGTMAKDVPASDTEKRSKAVNEVFGKLAAQSKLNIDLNEIDKYYKQL